MKNNAANQHLKTSSNTHMPLLAGEVLEYHQPSRALRILLDATALLALITLTAMLLIAA